MLVKSGAYIPLTTSSAEVLRAVSINALERIKDAEDILEVPLMDFIVCGDNCYYSAKEQGYL